MKQLFFIVLVTLFIFDASAQRTGLNTAEGQLFQNDTTSFRGETEIKYDGKTSYKDYKIISIHNDTTVIDTTLTLQKDFKFNYLRKDNFELLPFHNQGQTFSRLGYNFENNSLFPLIGANAKLFNYNTLEDVYYYEVPTPTSEIMYRTGLEQGQVLDAFLTMNTSRQFNFSMAYKGLRSLGKYRNSLASHGNFRSSFNYHSKRNTYFLRGHFSSFDFLNNENGGLTSQSISFFENNDPNYIERARLDVNYTDAENMLEGKRYYIEQQLTLLSKNNKLEQQNAVVLANLKKYNLVLKQIDYLKNGDTQSPKKQPTKRGLPKDIKSRKKPPLKDQKNNSKIDSLPTPKLVKTDSIVKKSTDINQKYSVVKNDSVPATDLQKMDSISMKQIKSDIKLDSDVAEELKKVDSLTTKTISTITSVIKKNDSISQEKNENIDSISVKQVTAKNDSLIQLDSLALEKLKMIDSLTILAAQIKTDSSQLVTIDKKSYFELNVGHSLMYETKHYRFKQDARNDIFGDAFESTISDHASYQKLDNQLYLQLNSNYTGDLKVKFNYFDYNYHFNSILFYDDQTISDKLKGNAIAVGAEWKTQFGKVHLNADASTIITGDLTGSALKASAMFKKDSIFSVKAFAEFTSKTPDFNTLLYQSDYLEYNWQNDFSNEEISTAGLEFKSAKWGSLKASYHLIDNFTYFDETSKPIQATETLNYIKVKAHKAISYKKFTLDNTVMYQQVSKGEAFFRVPEIVTRNSFYFSSYVFKGKPMYLQTGVTAKYFTSFRANAYNPLLSEFVLQNTTEIGNFPVIDFFANAQIRRTRIFLKVENLNASFTGRTYYAAPNYPYRDLTVRFGVVWNWFI
jgi:hypothetical protein